MLFTHKEIIELKKPYEQFSNGDVLAEHAKVLNQLSKEEQHILASLIIADCPVSNFKKYRNDINALNIFKENGFHSVLSGAYEVRSRIYSLLDLKNKMPHTLFLEMHTLDLLNKFSSLAIVLLGSNEQAITERLALCTPEESRSTLARNLEIAFPGSPFESKSKMAFTIRCSLDKLLGENPEQFFESRDFNKDAYTMYPNMVHTLLKGKEEQIGKKLAVLEPNLHIPIRHQLQLLHTETVDDANPFKLIAKAMESKLEEEKNSSHDALNHVLTLSRKSSASPIFFQPPRTISEPDEEEQKKASLTC